MLTVIQKDVFNEGKQGKTLSFGELLIAAGVSGMPGESSVWL
jgi:solute carrier family 25 aspartate/glutamate transporter 12/13